MPQLETKTLQRMTHKGRQILLADYSYIDMLELAIEIQAGFATTSVRFFSGRLQTCPWAVPKWYVGVAPTTLWSGQ